SPAEKSSKKELTLNSLPSEEFTRVSSKPNESPQTVKRGLKWVLQRLTQQKKLLINLFEKRVLMMLINCYLSKPRWGGVLLVLKLNNWDLRLLGGFRRCLIRIFNSSRKYVV